MVGTLRRRIARTDRVDRYLMSKLPGVRPRAEDGFTLIELVIVLIIIPIIIGGVTTAIIMSLQNQNVEYHRIADSVDPQIASTYFTRRSRARLRSRQQRALFADQMGRHC